MKILIIDDEVLIGRTFSRFFSKSHEVRVAIDGTDGLKQWIDFQPDLVILDFIMPGLNAEQLLDKVKPFSKAKVCLISAYIGDTETETQILKRVDLFIAKPFEDIVKVCDKILKILGA
ncbi:MAG: response regulator [Bdellovibrionaceae bacterium]|nr:response regulator [Pseudobdellovibrionaceae bacterium]NUM59425.1 response regulator [Pseudobdellovibrionaceae bacterium]